MQKHISIFTCKHDKEYCDKMSKIIITLLLIILQVFLKFSINRKTENKHVLELVIEFPTNIVFGSLSLMVAYLSIANFSEANEILIPTIAYIIFLCVVVFIFRKCREINDKESTLKNGVLLILLLFANYFISLSCIYYSADKVLLLK